MNENLKVYPYIDPDAGIDDADRRKGESTTGGSMNGTKRRSQ